LLSASGIVRYDDSDMVLISCRYHQAQFRW
jgi:hypothetical protein